MSCAKALVRIWRYFRGVTLTSSGGGCGATFIDRNFYALMTRRFGGRFTTLAPAMKAPGSKFMRNFETIKKTFGYNDDDSIKEVEGLDMDSPASAFWDKDFKAVRLTQ